MSLCVYAQNSTSVKSFTYPDYLSPHPYTGNPMYSGETIEISYSAKTSTYGIDFRYGYLGFMLSLKYKGMTNGKYVYGGFETNNMLEAIVITSVKLSRFLDNHGQIQDETFEDDNLIEVHIEHLGSLSIYPIKDTPERRKKIEEQKIMELKQAREDSIRKVSDLALLDSCLQLIDTTKITKFIEKYEVDFYKKNKDEDGNFEYKYETYKVGNLLWGGYIIDYNLVLYISNEGYKIVKINSDILDNELYNQYDINAKHSYTLNNTTYYKNGRGFFFTKYLGHQMLCGHHTITVKKKKAGFIYYDGTGLYKKRIEEKYLPIIILNKIKSDITEKGTYIINYTFVNDFIIQFTYQ